MPQFAYKAMGANGALTEGFLDASNRHEAMRQVESRGLKPRMDTNGGPNYVSFHVQDPDGFDLQISGLAKPGDSQYKKPGA